MTINISSNIISTALIKLRWKFLIITSWTLVGFSCCAQTPAKKSVANTNSDSKIYSLLIAVLARDTSVEANIIPTTFNRDLRSFNFKNPNFYSIGNRKYKITQDEGWNSFLKNIDTSGIAHDYSVIDSANMTFVGGIKFLKFDSTYNVDSLYNSRQNASINIVLRFSSILYNTRQDKAVCAVQFVRPEGNNNTSVFFLEVSSKRWKIFESIPTSLN